MSKTFMKKIELREEIIEHLGKHFLTLAGSRDLLPGEVNRLIGLGEVDETRESYIIDFGCPSGIVKTTVCTEVYARVYAAGNGVCLWADVQLPTKSEILSGFGTLQGTLEADETKALLRVCKRKCRAIAEAALSEAWRQAWLPASAEASNARITAELAEKIRTAELFYRTRDFVYFCDSGRFYRQPQEGGSWQLVKAPQDCAAYKDGENFFGENGNRSFFVEKGCVTGGADYRGSTTSYTTPYEWLPSYNCYSNVAGMTATTDCWKNKLWNERN